MEIKKWILFFILIGKSIFSQPDSLTIITDENYQDFFPIPQYILARDTTWLNIEIKKHLEKLENNGYPACQASIIKNNDSLYVFLNKGPYKQIQSFRFNVSSHTYYKNIFQSLIGNKYSYNKIIERISFLKNKSFIDFIRYHQLQFFSQSNFCQPYIFIKEKNSKKLEGFVYYKEQKISGQIMFQNMNILKRGIGLSLYFNRKNEMNSKTGVSFFYPSFLLYPGEHEFLFEQKKTNNTDQQLTIETNHRFFSFSSPWSYSLRFKSRMNDITDNITNKFHRDRLFEYGFFCHYQQEKKIKAYWGGTYASANKKIKEKVYSLEINFLYSFSVTSSISISNSFFLKQYFINTNTENSYYIDLEETRVLKAFPYIQGYTNQEFNHCVTLAKNLSETSRVYFSFESKLYKEKQLIRKHNSLIGFRKEINHTFYDFLLAIPIPGNIGESYFYFIITI